MVIASTVDAMTRERAVGISAWILTKPVSRPSYLLAKASAHTAINIVTLILIPTVIWLAITFVLFADLPAARILLACVILGVEVAFLSFLTIALGVPFRSVTPVSLITLAVWFLPNFVPAVASLEWTYRVLPSYLPLAAVAAAADTRADVADAHHPARVPRQRGRSSPRSRSSSSNGRSCEPRCRDADRPTSTTVARPSWKA